MRRWRISRDMVVIAGLLAQQGCLFKKEHPKASIVIPPAPQAQPPKPMPSPPQLPAEEPKTSVDAGELPTLPPPVQPPKPVKQQPARKTGGASGTQAEQHPAAPAGETPVIATPPLTPNPEPSLQPILGSREIQERNRRIQGYLDKARLIVLRAERSNPDGAQKALIGQVRTFLQQAEEARRVDLARAENLAERAEVLSRGLNQ